MNDIEPRSRVRASRRGSLGQQLGLLFTGSKNLSSSVQNKQGRRSSLNFTSISNTLSVEEPKVIAKKHTRRASLGQMLGAQRIYKEDSTACITECSYSIASNEQETEVLLREVNETIRQLTVRKDDTETNIDSCLMLAKARLASGNQIGAILSMRRVHKNTTMVAYAAGARYQLIQIRDNLESHDGTNVSQCRRAFRTITRNLLKSDAPTPCDAFLLNQLESQMEEIGF